MMDFRAAVAAGVIIGDGAMATVLNQNGVPVRSCSEGLCLTNPELVGTVHRSYVEAGATLLQTHTFGAHRTGLARYGQESKLQEINLAAVRIARDAAAGQAYVFGTIGSIAGFSSQGLVLDQAQRDLLRAEFCEQAMMLLAGGVDGLILETFPELDELWLALAAIRPLTDVPVIAHLSPVTVGFTRDGVPLAAAFATLLDAGADGVGLNCELGPANILRSYESIPLRAGTLYSAVPNSGLLHVQDGEYAYTGGPAYFGDVALQLAKLGLRLIGGCCGTTPEHIRCAAERIGTELLSDAAAPQIRVVENEPPSSRQTGESVATAPSRPLSLLERVQVGRTLIVELDPPRTLNLKRYLQAATALQAAGADMITLADNSLGSVRVSNMAVASVLKGMGIEPLVHVTCRDRNLIGQQSHLMGLHVLGIHNILLVTGDPTRFGDLPGATSVYDVSSTELARMVKRLNAGVAFSGQTLKTPARFIVGTAFNPNVKNFDKAVERLQRKVEAGADYVMTQPIFDADMIRRIHAATAHLGVPVFIGITPLTSERNAVFLHNEVPGVTLPESVLKRMSGHPDGDATKVGLEIAEELMDVALAHFSGIYLMTPFLRYELTERLIRYTRLHDQAHSADPTAIGGKPGTLR